MVLTVISTLVVSETSQAAKPDGTYMSPLLRGLVGGAAYGFVAAAISHPFDTLKTRSQMGVGFRSPRSFLSGLLDLYRGVGPATLASVCFRTVPFIGYEATTNMMKRQHLLDNAPLAVAFIGGAVGGMLRGCLETPAEFMKTRLQLKEPWTTSLLLRGLFSTCMRNGFVIGLYWVFFEASKAVREAYLPPVSSGFIGGGCCSVLAWAIIYPLDTAKSCIQATSKPISVTQQLVTIYRQSGLRGWYAGLGPGLTRAFLANGGGMAVYEIIQHVLGGRPSSSYGSPHSKTSIYRDEL